MHQNHVRNVVCAAAVAAALAGCGSSSTQSTSPGMTSNIVSIPGITSTATFSFDLGTFDSSTNRYYVTDRTNKSIDMIDLNAGGTVTQFKPGFFGCGGQIQVSPGAAVDPTPVSIPTCVSTAAGVFPKLTVNNDNSGPDGVDIVGPNLYVGDVGNVWIINKASGALVKKLATQTPTLRADEGCFDPDDNIYAISTPGAANPYMTFIDTVTQTIIAHVTMDQPAGTPSGGLEACVYDHATLTFYVNNDGSSANGRGEMDGIPAADIVALKPGSAATVVQFTSLAATKKFPLGACDPTGIALGPGTDIGAMCRQGNNGETLTFQILNKNTGLAAAAGTDAINAGGGDQSTYDAASNNWFLATSRWTPAGTSCGAGSATCVLTPVLTIVNGTTRTVTSRVASGNNSHSVATGAGLVFSPFTNGPSATAGGVGFPNGGVAEFLTH